MIFNRNIKKLKLLGKFNVNLEKSGSRILVENDDYIFYLYNNPKVSYDSFYLLRQNKKNKKNIVNFEYFNEKFLDNLCLYKSNIICGLNGNPEVGMWDYFLFIDVNTGKRTKVKLRSKYGDMVFIGGYGRVYNQDSIIKMYVEDDKLNIDFRRKKCSDDKIKDQEHNKDMNYKLIITEINGDFSSETIYDIN